MFSHLYPLYIDPGTGSMLFSVLLGLLASLYFVFRAVFIKAKFLFSGKKSASLNKADTYIIYCEAKQYINVFLPVLEAFEKRKISLLYYTSAPEDPALSAKYHFIKPEYIGEGNVAIARLNFLKADICLMTTPGLDVYQLKRSKGVRHYAHLLHAPSDASMYRLFGIDYFDSVLLSGDYQKKDIRLLEKLRNLPEKELITTGCPYLDVLEKKFSESVKKSAAQKKGFTVLVSPSWGHTALLSRYGTKLLDPLVKSGFYIIVRPHPQSKKSETAMLKKLEQCYKDCPVLEWDYQTENTSSLARSDIMISDFSGIIFDYIFLADKPFLYVNDDFDLRPYDAGDLMDLKPAVIPWQFEVLPLIGKKLLEQDFENIADILLALKDNSQFAAERKKAKETAWMYRGESGERIADFMIQQQKKIQEADHGT